MRFGLFTLLVGLAGCGSAGTASASASSVRSVACNLHGDAGERGRAQVEQRPAGRGASRTARAAEAPLGHPAG